MSWRILLASGDTELAGQLTHLTDADPELELVDIAWDTARVPVALRHQEVETVILDEQVGPLPAMDLARELSTSFPQIGLILVAREATPSVLRAALQAGCRDVLAPPLTLEALRTSLQEATTWTAELRRRAAADGAGPAGGAGGFVIAVAGAKGGVGTTTVALQLALHAAGSDPERTVCLADLDLQSGDVRTLLDLPYRRGVTDLVSVAEELVGSYLDDALYRHESGLRVLLAPDQGEQAEAVRAEAARRIVGALRFRHSLVVIDVGSVVTEAAGVAVELADRVLLVTTPDVPALRGANRLVELWRRLEVLQEPYVRTVLNRVSRITEVQARLADSVLTAPRTRTTIPADFKALEPAVNTGLPGNVDGKGVTRAFEELAFEVGAVPAGDAGRPLWRRLPIPARSRGSVRRPQRSEVGSVTVEVLGISPIVVLVLAALWQLALVGLSLVLADHAAREGARSLAVGEPVAQRVRADLPGAWRAGMSVNRQDSAVKVSVEVPSLIPTLETPLRVSAREGTVVESEADGGARR